MIIFIDSESVQQAVYLGPIDFDGETRRYYEIGSNLIVCRNDFALHNFSNRQVDANVGWDIAQPGFTVDEHLIGQRRSKFTLYRPVRKRYQQRLGEMSRV